MKMREKLNCPNCGAPITGSVCEYCGTKFYDLLDNEMNIDLSKGQHYLRLNINGEPTLLKVYCSELSIEHNVIYSGLGRDQLGRLSRGTRNSKRKIAIEFIEI